MHIFGLGSHHKVPGLLRAHQEVSRGYPAAKNSISVKGRIALHRCMSIFRKVRRGTKSNPEYCIILCRSQNAHSYSALPTFLTPQWFHCGTSPPTHVAAFTEFAYRIPRIILFVPFINKVESDAPLCAKGLLGNYQSFGQFEARQDKKHI